jgi:hypothetical protein
MPLLKINAPTRQRAMETAMTGLNEAAFAAGLKIYTKGGNSGSYAKLT